MRVSSRSTLTYLLVGFYLLVAGGLPLADALVERVDVVAVTESGQSERGPGVPHDESCPLCLLLDRVASAGIGHAEVQLGTSHPAAGVSSDSGTLPTLGKSRAGRARAPPPG